MLATKHIGDGGRTLAQQWLVLPPGQYRMVMVGKVEDFALEPRMRWTLSCPGKPALNLAQIVVADTAGDWRDVGGAFTVPAGGCETQHLQLTAQPGLGPVRGWFDDIRIQSVGLLG